MLGKMLWKVTWGTTKFTVKHIVIPIAFTAGAIAAIQVLSEKMEAEANNARKVRGVIEPAP